MPSIVKKRWRLTVVPNEGISLPAPVKALDAGTLHVFGQNAGSKPGDDFNILSIKLTNGVNSASQFVSGVIDRDDIVEFVFVANGREDGDQFIFREGQVEGNNIIGGTIFGPPRSAGDEDLGTWSGTAGGGGEGEEEEDEAYG